MSYHPDNRKPVGRVRLEPALSQREKEEAMRLIEKFKASGLITFAPPLTDGQVNALSGSAYAKNHHDRTTT
jgi:hypothetical protein